jgi:hypothetical protein
LQGFGSVGERGRSLERRGDENADGVVD